MPGDYTGRMERVVRVFDSHAEAEKADHAYYAAMSPHERVELMLLLVSRYREGLGEAGSRFERVCRVARLSEG